MLNFLVKRRFSIYDIAIIGFCSAFVINGAIFEGMFWAAIGGAFYALVLRKYE